MRSQWRSRQSELGRATNVGQLIRTLAKDAQPESPLSELLSVVAGRNRWDDESVDAFDLLLESAHTAKNKTALLWAAAEVAGGDSVDAWLGHGTPLGQSAPRRPQAELEARLHKHCSKLVSLLSTGSASECSSVWLVAATLPRAAASVLDLAKGLPFAAPQTPKALMECVAALLAVATVAGDDPEFMALIDAASGSAHPTLRGAAAVAQLRVNPDANWSTQREALEAWLGWTPNYDPSLPEAYAATGLKPFASRFPWFADVAWRRSGGDVATRALSAVLTRRSNVDDLDLWLAIARERHGVVSRNGARVWLERAGFTAFPPLNGSWAHVALPSELDSQQVALATQLSDEEVISSAGCGVPAAGACRRRWLGLTPPGPLERIVPVTLAGTTRQLPVWRGWVELTAARQFGRPIPEQLAQHLSPFERWEAAVLFGSETYGGPTFALKPEEIEAMLSLAGPCETLSERALSLGAELEQRHRIAQREERRFGFNTSAALLLALPVARAGVAVPEQWDAFLPLDPRPQGRELLTAIGPQRAGVAVLRYLRWVDQTGDDGLALAMDLVDQYESDAVAEHIWQRLNDARVRARGGVPLEALRERFRTLGAVHPSYARFA